LLLFFIIPLTDLGVVSVERIYTRRWLAARKGTAELAAKTYKELFNEAAAAAAFAVRQGAATLRDVTPPLTPGAIKDLLEKQEQVKDIIAMEDTMTKALRERAERDSGEDKGKIVPFLPGAQGLGTEGEFKGVKYRVGGGASVLDSSGREERRKEQQAEWWHRYRAPGEDDSEEEQWPAPEDMEDDLSAFEGIFGGRWPPSRETHAVPPRGPTGAEIKEMQREARERQQQRQAPK